MARFQTAARAAVAGDRGRGAGGRCSSAAPACTCRRSSTTCASRARTSSCGPSSRRGRASPAAWRPRTRELSRRDPEAAARIDPHNARRIVRALEVIRLTGEPFSSFGPGLDQFGPTAFPVRMAGIWLPRAVLGARIDERFAPHARRRPRRRGRRLAAGTAALSRTAAPGDRVQGAPGPPRRRRAVTGRRVRHCSPPHPLVRPPPADVVPAGSRGSPGYATADESGVGPARPPGKLVSMTTRPALEAPRRRERLPRHRRARSTAPCAASPRSATGTGASAPTASSRCARAATAPTARWSCYNADGSQAEMSGNGIRCLAWVANRAGLGDGKRLVVDTGAGRREVELELDRRRRRDSPATVDMGPVTFEPAADPARRPDRVRPRSHVPRRHLPRRRRRHGQPAPRAARRRSRRTARVTQHGPRLETDERFPNRTNVEFVAVTGADELTMRVWERGVGETLSCGTGVCAAAAVAHRRGLVGDARRRAGAGRRARGRAGRDRPAARSRRPRLRHRGRAS